MIDIKLEDTRFTKGFTLVEVLVSLAIVSIILAAMIGVFERSHRLYTTQNAVAALQQDVRIALEIIADEARTAAYNPTGRLSGVDKSRWDSHRGFPVTTSTHLRFESDLDGDSKIEKAYNADGECERRSFRYSLSNRAIQMICGEATSSMDIETLLGGNDSNVQVTAFDLLYLDDNNTPATGADEKVGAIVSITAQTPAGRAGMVERTYETMVVFRNAGVN